MHKCVNLVHLEKSCRMTIWWPKSALIQPRTSLGKSDVSWRFKPLLATGVPATLDLGSSETSETSARIGERREIGEKLGQWCSSVRNENEPSSCVEIRERRQMQVLPFRARPAATRAPRARALRFAVKILLTSQNFHQFSPKSHSNFHKTVINFRK